MPDCELLSTCPYYSGMVEMAKIYKKQYCRRDYLWCGRYMVYTALEKEGKTRKGQVSASKTE